MDSDNNESKILQIDNTSNSLQPIPLSKKGNRKWLIVLLVLLILTILIWITSTSNIKSFCNSDLPENIATCIRYNNSESIIKRNLNDIASIMKEISETDSVQKKEVLAKAVMELASDSYLELKRLLDYPYFTNN